MKKNQFYVNRPFMFIGLASFLWTMKAQGADYSWNNSAQSNWGTATNWSPNGTPGSGDNILTPTLFGNILVNGASRTVNDWTYNSSSNQSLIGQNGAGGTTLTISGTLNKSGSGILTFRNSSGTANPLNLSVGSIILSGGSLIVGEGNSPANFLGSFTAGTASLSAGTASFQIGSNTGSGTATITGTLDMSGSSVVHVRGGGGTGILSVGALSSSSSSAIVRVNNAVTSTGNGIGVLSLNNASGVSAFAGQVVNGGSGTSANVMSVTKNGNGTQAFNGSNTYTGTTTIGGGTLLINGTHTNAGAYTVNGTGTLGGAGTVTTASNAGITVAGGAHLSVGDSSTVDTTATLTAVLGSGVLDISGAVGGANTNALAFELGATGTGNSDIFSLTSGVLNVGSGVLEFTDFNFTALTGFGAGTYTLFDTNSAITGALGSNLSGNIGGFSGILSFANSDNDLVLTVSAIPEPSSSILLGFGLGGLYLLRWKSSTGRKS